MRRHPLEGETMLRQIGGTLAVVGRFVRSSHERFDGEGYPDGLAGAAIPIESRIVFVCDAYNAMTTDRPYGAARPSCEARAELHRCSGSQFDPRVVRAMDRVLLTPSAALRNPRTIGATRPRPRRPSERASPGVADRDAPMQGL